MGPPARGATTRSIVVSALLLSAGILLLEAAAAVYLQRVFDQREQVSEQRLIAALETFRPSETAGRAREVPAADLRPERSVRSEPASCAPLSLLSTGSAVGGASWSGVSGRPVQPVNILTVRYADADQARGALTEKRVALLRCRSVRLTFAPYDEPALNFQVMAGPGAVLPPGRLSYLLVSGVDRYEFYVRRWGNTLTWTYDKDVDRVRVGRAVVDDLADRLAAMTKE